MSRDTPPAWAYDLADLIHRPEQTPEAVAYLDELEQQLARDTRNTLARRGCPDCDAAAGQHCRPTCPRYTHGDM